MATKIKDYRFSIYMNNDAAKRALIELEGESVRLVKKLDDLEKAGQRNSIEWKNTKTALDEVQKKMEATKHEAGLLALSTADLTKTQRALLAEYRKAIPGSEHREQLKAQLDIIKNRLDQLDPKAKQTGLSLGRMADGFNRYFAMATAFAASLTGIAMGFKSLKEERDKLEDSKANLKALTGLGQADVDRLTEMAKKMSVNQLDGAGIRIRQSAQEIVDAYTKVGSQKPELLKNADALNEVTKQALILATASKMEVVPAAEGLTNMMNQYGVSAKEAAHYMNVLAAGSQAGAKEVPYISEAMTKFGSVAKLSNVPVEQAVALIETLGEKGHAAEISGTGLKTFFVKLLQGADATNPKVVGMATALDNLAEKFSGKGGFSEMVKLFGQDNVVVAQTLIENRKRFEELTSAVTGTTVGMEQAAINSQPPAAVMAQAINKMKIAGVELVDKLQPAMSMMTGWFSKTVQALPGLVDWFTKWGGTVATTTVIIVAYIAVLNAQTLAAKVATFWNNKLAESFNSIKNFVKTNPYAAALIGLVALVTMIEKFITRNDALKNSLKDIMKDTMKDYRAQVELEKANANGLFEAYKNANEGTEQRRIALTKIKSLYGSYIQNLIDEKGNIRDIALAQQQVNTALEQNIALKITEAAKTKILEETIGKQTDLLTEMSDRMAMIKGEEGGSIFADQISSIFRQYSTDLTKAEQMATVLAMKSSQGQSLQFRTILADRIHQYKQAIAVQQKGLADLDKQFNRVKPATLATTSNNGSDKTQNDTTGGGAPDDAAAKKALDKKLKANEDAWKKLEAQRMDQFAKDNSNEEQYLSDMATMEIDYLEKKKTILKTAGQETGEVDLEIAKARLELVNKTAKIIEKKEKDKTEAEKKSAENGLKVLETEQELEIAALNKKRDTDKMSEIAYLDELYDIEVKFIEKKMKLIGLSADKIEELKKHLVEKTTQKSDNYAKEEAWFKEKYSSDKDKLIAWKELEQKILDDYAKKHNLTEKQKAEAQAILDKEYQKKKIDDYAKTAQEIANIAGNLSSAAQGFQQAEEMAVERKYKKLIKAAGKNSKQVTELEDKKEQELAAVKAKWADKVFILNAAQIVANTALAVMQAWATLPTVLAPIGAAAALLAGSAQLAVANQARENAKEGYFKGGYTGGDDPREVRGYFPDGEPYHGKEFVGNHKGVENPHVRQFYDIFDVAQKNGTIRMLNTTQILRQITTPTSGKYDGGYTRRVPTDGNPNNTNYTPIESRNDAVMVRVADTMERLIAKLDEPLEVPIAGRKGIADGLKRYNKLLANKDRG